jgi:serine/threonine protein kinase
VVDVYDYGSDQQIAFLVMEYVEGDALSRTLSRVGRLTPARTMALVAQAADALQAAHANGIVHRDVKPGNLLVRPNGTLVLTDFGIARSALVGQLTVAGAVLGTASYISPEQASGDVATPASDVYALGVVAYQCLSGHRPFDGATPIEIAMKHVRETPRPLPGDIPPAVRAIVERAMSKDPSARWPSASAMATVARQAASSLTTAVQQPVAHPPQPAQHQQSARAARPTSPAPVRPQSGAAARASVPRPVSGARGAASVPSSSPPASTPPGPMPPPYRPQSGAPVNAYPPQASPTAKPEGTFGRQVLVVLAVVLALLVLLCAGVISFLLRHGNGTTAAGNTLGYHSSSAAILRSGVVADPVLVTSYRLMKADAQLGRIRLNEGRQTL